MTLAPPISAGPVLDAAARQDIRRRMIFEAGKYDPQCGDTQVLAPFALFLDTAAWREISRLAEQLAHEALAAEAELCHRHELLRHLGLPPRIRRAIRGPALPNSVRFMRFDFHWTTAGWQISEVNSDVPGGFIESSAFPALMAAHLGDASSAADPADALVSAILKRTGPAADIGLIHATAYADDRQVMAYLFRRLQSAGARPHLLAPNQVLFRGAAHMHTAWRQGPLDALIRFFPGEWLSNLGRSHPWRDYFSACATPISNPATALAVQSKRFPLVWDALCTPLPTWRKLLPETRDPRRIDRSRQWVLKPALGRIGENIAIANVSRALDLRQAACWSRLKPNCWAAQERFHALPVHAAGQDWYPCLGVFVIDGKAAGIYGRMAPRPLIDSRACDVAILLPELAPGSAQGTRHEPAVV